MLWEVRINGSCSAGVTAIPLGPRAVMWLPALSGSRQDVSGCQACGWSSLQTERPLACGRYLCSAIPSPSLSTVSCLHPASCSRVGHVGVCVLRCSVLSDLLDCSPPGSSVRGVFQARILEWVAISSSRGSSPPRDQTRVSCVSCIADRFFTH